MKVFNKPDQLGGALFLAAVILGLVYVAVQIENFLHDEQQSPVQVIHFSGQFEYVDIGNLEQLIRKEEPGSFFELDVDSVHQLLEKQPWIYRASVRKQWPNTLQVYLVEQTPVAVWNGDMILNPYGEAYMADVSRLTLPALFGPGGAEVVALEGYNAMALLLDTSDLNIAELFLSERFAWQLRLANGIKLNLGRKQFMDRLQRFVDVYPLLVKNEKAIEYVDLRYDTGLAVGWQQQNQTDEESRTDV